MERRDSGLIVPGPVELELGPTRLTEYGREFVSPAVQEALRFKDGVTPGAQFFMGLSAMASFSNFAEDKILDHALGDGAWTMPTTVALALTTVIPTDTSTGASITEASYTGYARKVIAASALSASSGGEKKNSEALTFAECTAGSSTITGFVVADSSTTGAGNAICWGTVTSTAISTTQTPANVAANGLVVTLD